MKETVLITGGTGGIGSAVARKFAMEGYPVAVLYHTDTNAADALIKEIVQANGKAMVVRADVADKDQVTNVVAEVEKDFGPVGVVVHAATAPLMISGIFDAAWQNYEQHLAVALHGAVNVVQCLSPGMIQRKNGDFVFLLTAAMEEPPAGWSAYLSAKGALAQYARSVEHELSRHEVRVHTIAPPLVDTALTSDLPDIFKRLARERGASTTPELVAAEIFEHVVGGHAV